MTNITNVTKNVNVTRFSHVHRRPARCWTHRPKFWFSFHFSTRPRFVSHWPRRHWAFCPTWWSPWPVVHHSRTLVSPVYYSPIYHTTYLAQPVVHAAPVEPCPFSQREAWEAIADGNAHLALEAFACLAREHPGDGLSHVGYALANAMLGADESAVAIISHAVYMDVESLLNVPADSRLDEQVLVLLQRYSQKASDPMRQGEALFMIAALRTLLHDHAGAYFAVTEAIAHGATDDATAMLRAMLAEQLSQEMFPQQ